MQRTNKTPNAIREEFNSYGGSTIDLGHFKNKTMRDTPYKADMLIHAKGMQEVVSNNQIQGLNQTRFHKGFQRRQQANIHNAFTEEQRRAEIEAAKARTARNEVINSRRTEHLRELDARNGYNIINGTVKGQGPGPNRPQGIRSVEPLGSEAPARGKTVLRESAGRYFSPMDSGKNFEYRQEVLYKEGLLKDKHCGVLAVGKPEMRSYGIEDQFSKSEYTKNSDVTKFGLYEKRIPGTYTPRKLPGNPSGNPQIVEKWNTNIDLNNRTLRNNV